MSRGTGFAGPQAGSPLGGQGGTRSERPWGHGSCTYASLTPSPSLPLVIIAPDLLASVSDDEHARGLAERSRQLRIGLLENGYNIVAVLPADTFLDERLAQL